MKRIGDNIKKAYSVCNIIRSSQCIENDKMIYISMRTDFLMQTRKVFYYIPSAKKIRFFFSKHVTMHLRIRKYIIVYVFISLK